ncbi:MAG: sugar ABC transporter permease [Thermostichus sp. HHBFW_bins_43]
MNHPIRGQQRLRERLTVPPLKRWGLLFWTLPALAFLLAFAFYPIAYAFYLSLFRYRLTDPNGTQVFVGLQNYVQALQDPQVQGSLMNTLLFVGVASGIELILGLGIAWLLDQRLPGMGWVRALLLTPMALAPVVVALVWRALYNPDFGLVSQLLGGLGIPLGRGLIGEAHTALWALIWVDIWQWTPLLAITFFAGLQSQPPELLQAAQLDGANGWQGFRYISLPLLRPVLVIALLLRAMELFKIFDSVLVITGGGPGRATEVISYHIFKVGLTFFDVGYGAALSVLLMGILVLFLALYGWVVGWGDRAP